MTQPQAPYDPEIPPPVCAWPVAGWRLAQIESVPSDVTEEGYAWIIRLAKIGDDAADVIVTSITGLRAGWKQATAEAQKWNDERIPT